MAVEPGFARSTHKELCKRIERVADRLFEGEEGSFHVEG
jgi:hypothetical protein